MTIVEKTEPAASWLGRNGMTSGEEPLAVTPIKDVGFPYQSHIEFGEAGATRAFLGGTYLIGADDVTVRADSTNEAQSDAININVLAVVLVDTPETEIATSHVTEAFVATDARTFVLGGDLALAADSTSRASAGEVGVTISTIDVAYAKTTTNAGGATRAFLRDAANR